tara:strand:+ start:9747 stop:10124 length:378 start_codon:yes stop_codon:yes gene_type:complete
MKQVLIVFIGGGLGTVMRFLTSKIIPYSGKGFPWSTFSANMIGCLIIGVITGYFLRNISENQSEWILFATIGFCGGFTTFSSFANENFLLLREDNYIIMLIYSILSVLSGILMIYLGIMLERYFH